MDPNQKLSLRYRVQRSIRRRKPESPFWYLLMAAVLVGACFLLKYFPIEGKIPEYDGLAGKEGFTATERPLPRRIIPPISTACAICSPKPIT